MKHLTTSLLHTAWTNDESKCLDEAISFVENYAGENFLQDVGHYLFSLLLIDYIMIARQVKSESQSEVLLKQGKLIPNITYQVEGSPCANVLGKDLCYFPYGVQSIFPNDYKLKEFKTESYFGVPLFDNLENSLGILVLMHSSIIERGGFVEALLNAIIPRIEKELLFIQLENQDKVPNSLKTG